MDEKVWIKTAKVNEDVKHQKAQAELQGDIKGYFGERDKTNRGLDTKISDATETSKAEAEVKELLYDEKKVYGTELLIIVWNWSRVF